MNDQDRQAVDSLDLERFRVRSRDELLRILRDLARDNQLVSVYFNQGAEFLLTTLLGLDGKRGKLVLDEGPDEQVNRRLLAAGQGVVISTHHHVRIQFKLEQLTQISFEGRPALMAAIPSSLIRVQRREFYRINTPAGNRLQCSFKGADGMPVEAPVVDISVGGVGLVEPGSSSFAWEPGTLVRDVRVDLPGGETIVADMEIRNRFAAGAGGDHFRVGCMFLHLDNRQSAAIQRYIHRTELERRRILQG